MSDTTIRPAIAADLEPIKRIAVAAEMFTTEAPGSGDATLPGACKLLEA